MAINTNEATPGSFFDRLGEAGALCARIRNDWRTGGNYDGDFNALISVLDGSATGFTASGDIQPERDLAQYVRRLLESGQAEMEKLERGLKWVVKEILKRHIGSDTSFGEFIGSIDTTGSMPEQDDELMLTINQELRRQLADPAGTAPAITVQRASSGVTTAAGADNVGNGYLMTSTKRGDGLDTPFVYQSSSRLRCVQCGRDKRGFRNREVFLWQDSDGVAKTHPDWGEGGRGARMSAADDRRYLVADPTAWA